MTGLILYSAEDADKNKHYIQMYVDKFKNIDIDIKLCIVSSNEAFKLNYRGTNVLAAHLIEHEDVRFVINRSRNFKIAQTIEEMGVRVFNSAKVTEICNNKGYNYRYIKDEVPFMPVIYEGENIESFIKANNEQYPCIIKSCTGHGGKQVFMVKNEHEKESAIKEIGNDDYVIQQCCSDLGKDVRVYVVGNNIVAAMMRTSEKSFKSNFSLGGNAEKYELKEDEIQYVKRITKKLSLDFAAIDFIYHNKKAVFNEIEDAAGAIMLYSQTNIDIVQLFVDYIKESVL